MYKYRFFIAIVPADLVTATQFAHEVFGDPLETAGNNFSVELVDAQQQTQKLAGCGVLTDEMVQAGAQALQQVPSALFWRWSLETGGLINSNHSQSVGSFGQPWDFQACLTAVGLHRPEAGLE